MVRTYTGEHKHTCAQLHAQHTHTYVYTRTHTDVRFQWGWARCNVVYGASAADSRALENFFRFFFFFSSSSSSPFGRRFRFFFWGVFFFCCFSLIEQLSTYSSFVHSHSFVGPFLVCACLYALAKKKGATKILYLKKLKKVFYIFLSQFWSCWKNCKKTTKIKTKKCWKFFRKAHSRKGLAVILCVYNIVLIIWWKILKIEEIWNLCVKFSRSYNTIFSFVFLRFCDHCSFFFLSIFFVELCMCMCLVRIRVLLDSILSNATKE